MSASRCIETSLFYQKTLKFTIVWQKRDWNFLTSGRYCILKIGNALIRQQTRYYLLYHKQKVH